MSCEVLLIGRRRSWVDRGGHLIFNNYILGNNNNNNNNKNDNNNNNGNNNNSGQTLVVATIKKQSAFQLESSADVYIHNVSGGKLQILHL